MEPLSSLTTEELVRSCTAPDGAAAWAEFVRRFQRLIALVVMRTASRLGDGSRQTVDDLVQEVYLKLCADHFQILRGFQKRHADSFAGYLKVLSVNVVKDHFKLLHAQKRGSGKVGELPEFFVPAASEDAVGGQRAMEHGVLLAEIHQHLEVCLQGADRERNRRIFWLYYRMGLSASAIAALPGIGLTTKGTETLLLRMSRDLRQHMASLAARPPAKKQEGIHSVESL